MGWYSVHALLYFEHKKGKQGNCLIWEHVYLIQAKTPKHAGKMGVRRAKQDEGDDGGSLTLNGRPVTLKFGGIRQICECQDLDLETGLPTHGTELTYSEYSVASLKELAKLVAGEPVRTTLYG